MRKKEKKYMSEDYPALTIQQVDYLSFPPNTYYFRHITEGVKDDLEKLANKLNKHLRINPVYDEPSSTWIKKRKGRKPNPSGYIAELSNLI